MSVFWGKYRKFSRCFYSKSVLGTPPFALKEIFKIIHHSSLFVWVLSESWRHLCATLLNFGSYLWFQIKLALRTCSILKSHLWFQIKLHSTQFNYHYELYSTWSNYNLTNGKRHSVYRARKKPVRSSERSTFSLWANNFLSFLARWARTQARFYPPPTKFLKTILRRKGKL